MFKKSLVMIFALILPIIPVLSFSADNTQELTELEISKKFDEINSKYQINERFSDVDALFIKKYAKVAESTESIIRPHGVIQEVTRFYIEGSRDVGLSSVSLLGYGVVGSDGVGIVANKTLSYKANNANFNKYQDNETFYGLIAYYQVSAKTIIEDSNQSLTLQAEITKGDSW